MSRRWLLFLCSAFRNPRTSVFLTDKNIGYAYGHLEAIADCFDFLREFDLVVHMHPDVFIIDAVPFLSLLDSIAADENHADFYVTFMRDLVTPRTGLLHGFLCLPPQPGRSRCFCRLRGRDGRKTQRSGKISWQMLQNTGLSKKIVPRAQWMGEGHRKIDELGLWHEHSYRRVMKYFFTRSWLPKMGKAAGARWRNDFYLKPRMLAKSPDAPSSG